jgi:hypothetical protein
MVCALPLSSVGNGFAQALDYVALDESGVQLYVILHSMATLFACTIAVLLLRTHVTHGQWVAVIRCKQRASEAIRSNQRPSSEAIRGPWVAVVAVVPGLIVMGVPTPVGAQGNFGLRACVRRARRPLPGRRDALNSHRGAGGPPRPRARSRGRS